jgi:hypothetical protein
MGKNKSLILRAHIHGYIVLCSFSILIGIIFIIAVVVRWNEVEKIEFFKMFIADLLLFLFPFLWLNGFQIEITKNIVIYRDEYYSTKKMLRSEIKHVEVKSMSLGRFSIMPIPCLVFIPIDENQEPILINIKPFSPNDLSKLFELFDIDGKVRGLKIKKLQQRRLNK